MLCLNCFFLFVCVSTVDFWFEVLMRFQLGHLYYAHIHTYTYTHNYFELLVSNVIPKVTRERRTNKAKPLKYV